MQEKREKLYKEINSHVLILRLPRMATMPVTLTQNEVMSQTGDYTAIYVNLILLL